MARLPTVGGDDGDWGTILNEFLEVSLNGDGTLKKRVPEIIVASDGSGDYTTISDALTAAPSGGAVILIKRGTYAGGLSISTANVMLKGEGTGLVVVESPLSSSACINVAAAGVTIENIEINGRRSSGATGIGINVNAVNRCIIRQCYIHDTSSHGILLANSADSKIINNRIINVATDGTTFTAQSVLTGIHAQNSGTRRLLVAYNYISGWSQAVGLWFGSNDCKIAFNEIIDNYGYHNGQVGGTRSAVEDYGETVAGHGNNIWAYNTIDGSTSNCIECAQGVVGSQFIGNVLRNWNKFGDNTGGAFVIIDGGSSQRTKNVTFRDNRIYANSAVSGAIAVSGLYSTIAGNYFSDFTNSGLSGGIVVIYGSTASYSRVVGNQFFNCRGGVFISQANTNGVVISGNHIISPATSQTNPGIRVDYGSYHNISDNVMDLGGVNCPGIQLAASAGNGSRIERNTIIGATNTGIDVRSADNLVKDNHIVTTNVFGCIRLDGNTSLRNIVENNYCDSNNAARTIFLTSGAANNTIRANKLIGSSATVLLDGTAGSGNIISPNHLNNVTRYLEVKTLGAQTVGTTQTSIAHGLGYTPTVVEITMTSDGRIWKSAASDATNIFLTADAEDRTAEIFVR